MGKVNIAEEREDGAKGALSPWKDESLWGWGRYPKVRVPSVRPENTEALHRHLVEKSKIGESLLAYAYGRSYGDSGLPGEGASANRHPTTCCSRVF